MEKFERESAFIKYLQQLGVEISSKDLALDDLSFYTWKSQVVVEKPERFYDISKKLSIDELVIGRDGSLFFYIRVPFETPGSYWNVTLPNRNAEEFLQRHQQDYKAVKRLQ